MNIKRYVNGKPVTETEFKSLEIRNKTTSKIILDVARRAGDFPDSLSPEQNGCQIGHM